MAKILMVVAPERFRDEELFVTQKVLEENNHSITIASTIIGVIYGSRGGKVSVQKIISEIKTDEYDAVCFVGGGGSKLLFNNPDAIRIAREMYAYGKVVAAICLAPVILANAGILSGKRATVTGTESKTIEAKGAHYTGPGVVVDGRVVTANGPKSSQLFAQKIHEVLTNIDR